MPIREVTARLGAAIACFTCSALYREIGNVGGVWLWAMLGVYWSVSIIADLILGAVRAWRKRP